MNNTTQIITIDGVRSSSRPRPTTQAKARTWLDNVQRHWLAAGASVVRADADHLRVVTPSGAIIDAVNVTKGAQ